MKFNYKAKNKSGNIQSGVVVAVDQNKAESLLGENGLAIISLEKEQTGFSFAKLNPFGKSVKNKELVLFSRQLATLISARVPIIQALRILQEQITGKYLLSIINDLISAVENGDSLSSAMSKYQHVFGNVYVSLVMSGEVSGSLDKSLVYLAEQLEKDYELTSKVKSAMTYPVFVLTALVGITLLMFKFVLPNLTSVLLSQGGSLPVTTQLIINATNFINVFWWLVLIVIAGLILGFRYYLSTAGGRRNWDILKIRFPIIGGIFQKIYLARFARNLSTLIIGGIPIIKALQIVAEIINNTIYRDIILDTVTKIQSGKTISEGLTGHAEFPSIVTQMVRVGEQTAQLDDIMGKLANFYEKEVDGNISTLTTLLEPLIMIILGIGVGILVAGILMPIYNMANTAG
jgi:type IV pilus assembly protein PilC